VKPNIPVTTTPTPSVKHVLQVWSHINIYLINWLFNFV
jgi:hypothetical protein